MIRPHQAEDHKLAFEGGKGGGEISEKKGGVRRSQASFVNSRARLLLVVLENRTEHLCGVGAGMFPSATTKKQGARLCKGHKFGCSWSSEPTRLISAKVTFMLCGNVS